MKIKEQDFYFGAALCQISEFSTLATICKVKGKNGLFKINKNKNLLIKYSTATAGEWTFNFDAGDLSKDDLRVYYRYENFGISEIFVALVCGSSTICLLTENNLAEVIDLDQMDSQWITVSFQEGKQMQVRGTKGVLNHKVPHNAFPKGIFGNRSKTQEDFLWPPLSNLRLYSSCPELIYASENRSLDIFDVVSDDLNYGDSLRIFFSVSSQSGDWTHWTETRIAEVESLIQYQFGFEGYSVEFERLSDESNSMGTKRCDDEFFWALHISETPEELDPEDDEDFEDIEPH